MECRGEEGVVFMGVAFRELPGGRSRWRLPQSRDRELQGSTHCGYCVHGTHLLSIDHDHWNASTPATRCAIGVMPVAVSLPNAPPTATPSSVMGPITCRCGAGAAQPLIHADTRTDRAARPAALRRSPSDRLRARRLPPSSATTSEIVEDGRLAGPAGRARIRARSEKTSLRLRRQSH